MASGTLSVGRSANAYCVRLAGRCTMAESPAFHQFASQALEGGSQTVYVDVGGCQYLDSTFLGSLLDLHRKFGRGGSPRFVVIAADDARQRLFAPTQLHKVFNFEPAAADIGNWVDLCPTTTLSKSDMARHVMECHRRLAEVAGPGQKAFAMIAEQLERELATPAPERPR